VSSGTLADGRLSSNVALLTGTQTFSGAKTFSSSATFSSTSSFNGNATFNSSIGIGTSNPRARLEVNGGTSYYLSGSNWKLVNNGVGSDGGGYTPQVSILASHKIVADSYHAMSDLRIKNGLGQSDSTADLRQLQKIEITNYRHKDEIGKGSGLHKKVIAQQVEKVFPEAVSQMTNVVPDIYAKAVVKDGWVALNTTLKKGERVRLISDRDEGIHEVLEVREGAFRTTFIPKTDIVFVYGREVKDFRVVDYEAISMLNVSATQEIARRLEAKSAEVEALEALEQTALAIKQAATVA
jgi:hypothetical protein